MVFISILIITIAECIVCWGLKWFLLGYIISVISRLLFMSRLIGATVKVKSLCITEAFAAGVVTVLNILSKDTFNVPLILLYLGVSLAICLIMVIDDVFYLYVVEDE